MVLARGELAAARTGEAGQPAADGSLSGVEGGFVVPWTHTLPES